MALTAGTRLGSYEVLGPLGSGGMGEVYRARDTRLAREVAIKSLPEGFDNDPERVARFEREAKLLASLHHTNVGSIFGLEEVAGRRYLVLEFVEGETLADRLTRGALPVDEALAVCIQIATAVEVAHEAGIVHRDLKPGNVMIRPDGVVKVLDFGLAKSGGGDTSSSQVDLSASPTMAYGNTGVGVILGTAAYMSPEQARGKAVDRRTDIWSFGCILYECLTGGKLFEGETVSDMIARILEREPDWSRLPARTPTKVRDLLVRCLEKDAKRRMRDIGDARIELEDAVAGLAAASKSGVGLKPAAKSAAPAGTPVIAWALVGVLAVALVVLAAMRLWSPAPGEVPIRFAVNAPVGHTLPGDAAEFALSPDGRTLVFSAIDSTGTAHLWLRALEDRTPRMMPGTDNPDLPFWSPDGRWVGFFADGKLKRIGVGATNVENLADANNGRGGSINRDGVILFAPAGGGPLLKITRSGDVPVEVTKLDPARHQTGHRYPCFLPDGKHFLYAALPAVRGRFETFVGSLDGGAPVFVEAFDACPVYVEPGYLIYLRGQNLVAQRFDRNRYQPLGEPVSLEESPGPTGFSGAPCVSVSATGVLATLNGALPNTDMVLFDRKGGASVTLPVPKGRYEGVDFSPDSKRMVLLKVEDHATRDLWVFDRERGTLSRLTYGPGQREFGVWSPDGKFIAYASNVGGAANLYVRPAGGGEERKIFDTPSTFSFADRWSWDSRMLVAETLEEKTGWDLWTVSLDQPKPVSYLRTPYNERWGALSPDGRWLSYTSDESGKNEIFVQSFPTAGEKHQISTSGGVYSLWRRDGRELAFYSADGTACLGVDVSTAPAFRAGTPHVLFKLPPGVPTSALTPDFDHLLLAVPSTSNAPSSLNLLLHWDALLARKSR